MLGYKELAIGYIIDNKSKLDERLNLPDFILGIPLFLSTPINNNNLIVVINKQINRKIKIMEE